MNLKSYIQTFLDQTGSWAEEGTVLSYRQKLDRFAKFAEGRDVTSALLLEYKAALFRQGMKESSIAGYFSTVSLFLNWCVNTGLLAENPMPRTRFVVAQSERKPITEDELHRLIATAENIPNYEYWPLAISVAWNTGLRLSDVATLRNVSLNLSGCAIRLIPKKTRRHARMVEIPIPDDLMELLKVQSKGEYVFPDMAKAYSKEKRHKTLSNEFLYIARKAKIRKSFHCFRNTRISLWLEMGVSPALVSDMTGINLNQLMTYAKPTLESKRAALGLAKKKENVA